MADATPLRLLRAVPVRLLFALRLRPTPRPIALPDLTEVRPAVDRALLRQKGGTGQEQKG